MEIAFIHSLGGPFIETVVNPIARALADNGSTVQTFDIKHLQMKTVDGKMRLLTPENRFLHCDVAYVRVIRRSHLFALRRPFVEKGIPVVNDPDALSIIPDKLSAQIRIESIGIPTIPTMALLPGTAWVARLWSEYGNDVVIKPNRGMQGDGVRRFRSLADLLEYAETQPDDMIWLGQRYIRSRAPGDIRIFVASGKTVAAMRRVPQLGEWRANLHLGADAIPYEASDDEKQLAVRATKACGLHIAGIDMLDTVDGPVVIEVNPNPGITIGGVTGVDVCHAIAETVWMATEG